MTPLIAENVGNVFVTKLGWLNQRHYWSNIQNRERSISLIKSDGSCETVPGQEIYKDKKGNRLFTVNRRSRGDMAENDILWDTDPGLPLKPPKTVAHRSRPVSNYELVFSKEKENYWNKQGNFVCSELTYIRRRVGRKPTNFYHAMMSQDFIAAILDGKPCKYSIVIYNLSESRWLAIKTPVTNPKVSMSIDGLTILAYTNMNYCVFDNPFI